MVRLRSADGDEDGVKPVGIFNEGGIQTVKA
jgi:hypothetical protein